MLPGDLMCLQQILRNMTTVRLSSTKSDKVRLSAVLESLLDYSALAAAVGRNFIRTEDRMIFPPGPNGEVWRPDAVPCREQQLQ